MGMKAIYDLVKEAEREAEREIRASRLSLLSLSGLRPDMASTRLLLTSKPYVRD